VSALDVAVTRRRVLALAVTVATGCTTAHRRVTRGPDAAALAAARAAELQILQATDRAAPAYAVHLAHCRALGISAAASPTASRGTTPPTGAAGASLARAGVPALQAAANAMRNGANAAVLASIAASHASEIVPHR
jgi:hypothetical protein